MTKHSKPEDGKKLKSWRWQNMEILTKAKHSKGRAGREKRYMGMRRMQDKESRKEKGGMWCPNQIWLGQYYNIHFINTRQSESWLRCVLNLWGANLKHTNIRIRPSFTMFCLSQDHHVLPSSGLQCLAIIGIGMFCLNQDCKVLPSSGLECFGIIRIAIFCQNMDCSVLSSSGSSICIFNCLA